MRRRTSAFRWWRAALAAFSVVCVLVLTHMPPGVVSALTLGVLQGAWGDKIGHGVAYGLITMSVLLAAQPLMSRRRWILIVSAVASVGAGDELTQPLASRDCSGWDWTADLAGIAVACMVLGVSRLLISSWNESGFQEGSKYGREDSAFVK